MFTRIPYDKYWNKRALNSHARTRAKVVISTVRIVDNATNSRLIDDFVSTTSLNHVKGFIRGEDLIHFMRKLDK